MEQLPHDWQQDWDLVTIIVPGIEFRNKLTIDLKRDHISIEYDGVQVLSGNTFGAFYSKESMWYIVKDQLYVELSKVDRVLWWPFIVKGVSEKPLPRPKQT